MKNFTPLLLVLTLAACARDKGNPETPPPPPVPVQTQEGPSALCDNDFQHMREDQAATEAALAPLRKEIATGRLDHVDTARGLAQTLLDGKRAYRAKHPGAIVCFRDSGDGHYDAIKGPDLDTEITDLEKFLRGL